MNLDHLKYLVTVADCGSIHEASRQLLLKQQYISSVIKQLEHHFGTPLFERHSKGVTPTDNGCYLIDKARQMLALQTDMESDYLYPDNPRLAACQETITFCMPVYIDTTALLEVCDTFSQYFPNVTIHITSKSLPETYTYLSTDPASLALFASGTPLEDLSPTLPPNLTFTALASMPLALVADASNPQAQGLTSISIADALALKLAFLAPRGLSLAPIYQTVKAYGEPNVSYTVDNPLLIFRLLQKQGCFTIAKQSLANDRSVLAIPFQEPIYLNLALLYHQDAPQSYAVQSFIHLIQAHHGSLLD